MVTRKMIVLYILVGVLSLTTARSSRAVDVSLVCEQFHDIIFDNSSVFAAPSPATGNGREINIPIRLHLLISDRSLFKRAREVNNWISQQLNNSRPNDDLSLFHAWSDKTAVITDDIKFKIYTTSDLSSQLPDYLNDLAWLESTTVLNSSVYDLLGEGTVSVNRARDLSEPCWLEQTIQLKRSSYQYLENSCPEIRLNETKACEEVHVHWKRTCNNPSYFNLRKGDIIYYDFNYTKVFNLTITTTLFVQDTALFSSIQYEDKFTFEEDPNGPIALRIDTSADYDGVFTVYVKKKCQHISEYSTYWKDYVNPTQIKNFNIVFSNTLINPTVECGRYEYCFNAPNETPGVAIFFKNILEKIEANDQSFWAHLSKAFGASIRKEDYHESCEQIKLGFRNDTIDALEQATKLRCWLYNSLEPFGNNFNRTQIFVKFSNGETYKLYVPTEKITKDMINHTLSCGTTKVCAWEIVKSVAAILSTPTPSAPTTSKSRVVPTVSSCRTDRSCHEPIKEIKIIYEFYDNEDISSLSHQDIVEWTRKSVHVHINDYCLYQRTLKMTLPVDDLNKINRDLVSVQYELGNGQLFIKEHKICRMKIVQSYNCGKEAESISGCHRHKRGLQRWHIISFCISGVLAIIACALIAFYCHIRRSP